MKLRLLTASVLLATVLPVHAGFMMGAPNEAASAAFDTVVSFTDETIATALQTQLDTVTDLQSQLETLTSADETDADAIADVRSQLRDARQDLRSDIHEVVDSNDELKTALQEQRETAQTERAVTKYALQDETAYTELLSVASDSQATSLETNQLAIEDLKTQASAAREEGASREEMREVRDQIHTLAQEQAEVVSEILDANEDLQTEFETVAEDQIADMGRPRRGGRH